MEAAVALAEAMHKAGAHLVYGGGTTGLMGQVARRLVELSGSESVHGIIPEALIKYERGPEANSLTSSEVIGITPDILSYGKTTAVKDMHTRKHMMAQEVLSGGPGSGFIALSGGYGTLEELMEVVTVCSHLRRQIKAISSSHGNVNSTNEEQWNQLGIHNKGIVALNIEGYWSGLLDWVKNSVEAGFVSDTNSNIIVEAKTPEDAIKCLREYKVAPGRFNLNWESN